MGSISTELEDATTGVIKHSALQNGHGDGESPTGEPGQPRLYTILSERTKVCTILFVATVNASAFFANTVYYPAIHSISQDLHIEPSRIYLTITAYMVSDHALILCNNFS